MKKMLSQSSPTNLGTVVSVRGSVVDIVFEERLPPIHSLLHTGTENQTAIAVFSQLDAHHVRGIALTPTQGLARGMVVIDTGGPLQARVGKAILSRMFDVFGNTIDRLPQTGDKGINLKQQLKDKLIEHRQYINKHGQDMPEIRDWKWKA